jgi:hypothetical protein
MIVREGIKIKMMDCKFTVSHFENIRPEALSRSGARVSRRL